MVWKKKDLVFEIVKFRVQTITITLWSLHIYIGSKELFHAVTYRWEYINNANSNNFTLPEFEKLKSCIYRVEPTNAGMRL